MLNAKPTQTPGGKGADGRCEPQARVKRQHKEQKTVTTIGKNRYLPKAALLSTALLFLIALWAPVSRGAPELPAGSGTELAGLLDRILSGEGAVSELDVMKMLTYAKAQGRPFAASQAVKKFLKTYMNPSAGLLRLAAENAALSGDLRIAVNRYKSYLELAKPSREASEATAEMYHLMIYFLYTRGDAYAFWKEQGQKFRTTVNARKYDHFFIGQAIRRGDYELAIKFLGTALEQAEELDKSLYYQHIVNLANELLRLRGAPSSPRTKYADQLAGLVGVLSKDWRRDYVLLASAYLKFRDQARGSADQVAKQFNPVLKQAKAWYAKDPRLVTVYKIFLVFASPERQHSEWRVGESAKRQFYQYVWEESSPEARRWLMNPSRNRYMNRDWLYPEASRRANALAERGSVWLFSLYNHRQAAEVLNNLKLSEIKRIAEAAEAGEAGWVGTMARGIAASDNPVKALDSLMARHGAWENAQFWQRLFFESAFFEAYEKAHGRDPADPAVATGRYNVLRHYYLDYYASSPAPIFTAKAQTRDLLDYFWREYKKARLSSDELGRIFRALNWVPYSKFDREQLFLRMRREFAGHRRDAPRYLTRLQKRRDKSAADMQELKNWEKAVTDLPKVEALFKEILAADVHKTSKPPNTVTTKARDFLLAWRRGGGSRTGGRAGAGERLAVIESARALHAAIKGNAEQPFKRQTTAWVCTYKDWALRLDVLGQELKEMNRTGDYSGVGGALGGIRDRNNRPWPDNIPRSEQETAEKINEMLSDGFTAELGKDRYRAELFHWIRRTQRGSGWHNPNWGQAAMEQLIRGAWLQKKHARPYRGDWPIAMNYMGLVRHEFRSLDTDRKYRVNYYFDDMFLEESKKLGFLDGSYRELGTDGRGKLARYVISLWQEGKDPFIDRHSEWRHRLLWGGGRDLMLDHYTQLHKKRQGVSSVVLGADGMRYGALSNQPGHKDRKAYFANFRKYVENTASYSTVWAAPTFSPLERVTSDSLTKDELDTLMLAFASHMDFNGARRDHRGWYNYVTPVRVMHQGLLAKKRDADLMKVIPYLWKVLKETPHGHWRQNGYKMLNGHISQLLERKKYELAAAYSLAGTTIGGQFGEKLRQTLESARSQAVTNIGGIIPVPPSDPRYKLFKAQRDYMAGNTRSAWKIYREQRGMLSRAYKDLDLQFTTWLIGKHTDAGETRAANSLARMLIQWVDEQPGFFDPEVRGNLYLAYANITFARQEYPVARARYETIRANPQFRGTRVVDNAELRIAEVDRLTKNFDPAIGRLEKLVRKSDPYVRYSALYQLALVKNDREEYKEAFTHLEQVLALKPDHAEAQILKAKLQIKVKKLEEATEIDLGDSMVLRVIIPGKPLKLKLEDKTLAIVQKSTNIEMRAWTKPGGDEEFFNLYPWADTKTKFRGKMMTVLGRPERDNKILELLGNDKVYYDFSEAFKAANHLETKEPIWLDVKTDASLEASSSQVLSAEEKKDRELLKMLIQERGDDFDLDLMRDTKLIKPGNHIYVQVIDPDQSPTAKPDKVLISAFASSGDIVKGVPLVESEGASGFFNGIVKTSKAQAVAFASDSMEGTEPNFVVSRKKYPAWVGYPDRNKPKWFSVDLNDNIALEEMLIVSGGREKRGAAARGENGKLKNFLVQVSYDNRNFRTVAAWPGTFRPWDGRLELEVVKAPAILAALDAPETTEKGKAVFSPQSAMANYLDWGYLAAGSRKVRIPRKVFALKWNVNTFRGGQLSGVGIRQDGPFLARLHGAFYVPKRQTRIFTVKHGFVAAQSRQSYTLLIDGKLCWSSSARMREQRRLRRRAKTRAPTNAFKMVLDKGVHLMELLIQGQASLPVNFDLWVNTQTAPYIGRLPGDTFDHRKHPELTEEYRREPARIIALPEKGRFKVHFPDDVNARVVRLMILDYEGDAPALKKITLDDQDGEKVLPTKQDFQDLRKNDMLEIIAGDQVTLRYRDPKVVTEGEEVHEDFMEVKYHDATVNASFIDYILKKGVQEPVYIPVVRFKRNEPILVLIQDPDKDVSEKRDTIEFTAKVTGKKPRKLKALETEPDSGAFTAKIFPMDEPGDRPVDLKVEEDDNIILFYMDQENTEPGIAWERTVKVTQVFWQDPELRVYSVKAVELSGELAGLQRVGKIQRKEDLGEDEDEQIIPLALVLTRPDNADNTKPASAYVGGPVVTEIIWPTVVFSPKSMIEIYAQTSAGREKYGQELPADGYDVNVPGTIKLTGTPSVSPEYEPPEGFEMVVFRGDLPGDELEEGVFTISIPTKLGECPDESLIDVEYPPLSERRRLEEESDEPVGPVLSIKGNDVIYVGFKYKDWEDQEHWITQKVDMTATSTFHVMDRRYDKYVKGMYVGQTVYFRVIDPMKDRSPEPDRVTVDLVTNTKRRITVELRETFEHTGEFHGLIKPVYATEREKVEEGKLGVAYGDKIIATYKTDGRKIVREIPVYKGSDGELIAFSKTFADKEIAVQTQFTIAEAFFELAKKHRALKKIELARREIKQGKRLLEEAMRDFPGTETKAQADYLLANLSLEFALDAKHRSIKLKHFMEAINRFGEIVASNPDSPYAPKSQYKKALTYEKMGQLDHACEEYVKLSYRYPNNELVAETISRLGGYFWKKGKAFNDLSGGSDLSEVEAYKLKTKSKTMYRTAAEVFGRLAVRFPLHKLAGKTTVLSGQAYIQAQDYPKAIEVLEKAVKTYEGNKKLAPEAMYWCADSQYRMKELVGSYRMWKRLTWDYPATKWAKYARGRLAQPDMVMIEEKELSGGM